MDKETIKTEAIDLKNCIQYQDNSVVSKTLINKKTGTLTLFSFDQGQGLSEHTAPFDAVVQIIDGEAEINIGGNILNTLEGQLVIMPANVPHSLKAKKKFKMLLIMVRS